MTMIHVDKRPSDFATIQAAFTPERELLETARTAVLQLIMLPFNALWVWEKRIRMADDMAAMERHIKRDIGFCA